MTPPVQLLDDTNRRILTILGVMLIAGISIVGLWLAMPVITLVVQTVMPLVVALIFAYVFDPIVTFVQRRLHLSRVAGVLFLYLLILGVLAGFVAIVLPILVGQIKAAWSGVTSFVAHQFDQNSFARTALADFQAWLEREGLSLEALLKEATRSTEVRAAARSAATSGVRAIGDALTFALLVAGKVFGGIAFLVITILLNIYVLIDFSDVRRVMETIIPANRQPRVFEVLGKVDAAVGGFMRGILIDAALVGFLTFVGLYAVGVRDFALLIGILAGIGTLVPYMGTISGGVPAALYILFSDQFATMQDRLITGLMVAAVIGIIQTLEGLIFQPRIIGSSANLHPIAVMVALAFGSNFGIVGMLVAVPAACILRVLFKEFYWDRRAAEWESRQPPKPPKKKRGAA